MLSTIISRIFGSQTFEEILQRPNLSSEEKWRTLTKHTMLNMIATQFISSLASIQTGRLLWSIEVPCWQVLCIYTFRLLRGVSLKYQKLKRHTRDESIAFWLRVVLAVQCHRWRRAGMLVRCLGDFRIAFKALSRLRLYKKTSKARVSAKLGILICFEQSYRKTLGVFVGQLFLLITLTVDSYSLTIVAILACESPLKIDLYE